MTNINSYNKFEILPSSHQDTYQPKIILIPNIPDTVDNTKIISDSNFPIRKKKSFIEIFLNF